MSRRASAAALLALALGWAMAARAQPRPGVISSGGFVTRLGTDTLSVETFERTSESVTGRIVRRVPRTSIVDYSVQLGRDGRPEEAEFRVRPAEAPPGATPRLVRVALGADSAFSQEMRDTLVRRSWALPRAFLLMPDSYALAEVWLAWFRASGQDTATLVQVTPLGGLPSGRSPVRKGGRDSVYLLLPTGPFRMRADAQGRLLALDGSDSPVKHVVTRVASADLAGFAARAAALDREGRALGAWVSPRDTVRASIGGASLWVDYGRPSKRGRRVFERGVLGDTLWRTGANAATQLSTDRDLVFGDRRLPAGKYTLWTRVTGNRYALLVNSQTGQWGTVHDPARDLIMVPLEKRRLAPAVETFTIRIEPVAGAADRGLLRLQWDDAELVTGFVVGR